MTNIKQSTLVFDLDDTLYKELDYQRSGVTTVSDHIKSLYGMDIKDQLIDAMQERADIWSLACDLLNLPIETKETFLWIYRLHDPKISMTPSAKKAIERISKIAKNIAILTDGRSFTQRKKLEALGLSHIPAFISEEYQSVKPSNKRFAIIMDEFTADNYVYIGDNPKKDFIAPNSLNWITVCLHPSNDNVHQYDINTIDEQRLPRFWIKSLDELEMTLS
jgi:putative hydrolase of the HAD superfamily